MTTKLGRMLTYLEGLLTIKSHNALIIWSCKIYVTNENYYISATRVLMTTKVGRTVAYFESLLTMKSFYTLITWSFKVT